MGRGGNGQSASGVAGRKAVRGARAQVSATTELCRDLAHVGAADRADVGGKAASLGELASAGVRVPPGFVVTTAAFGLAMAVTDPDGAARRDLERLGPPTAAEAGQTADPGARMRERILATELPDAVRAEIGQSYRRIDDPGGGADDEAAVAVRSSATAEDSDDASFAGLQDTYLWVRGEAHVTASVRRCWASLYSPEAASYRARLPAGPAPGGEAPAMAVVIQQMVDARCAGVMFTCSPTTGDRSVVAVEATWGLGSALVSGCVTPDSYVVSKVTGEIIKRTVPVKLRQHRRAADGTGVAEADVPGNLQGAACLTDDEIGELARIALRVEQHYGRPQDIEWAIADGDAAGVFVLQSRPETVWAGREAAPVAVPKRRAFDHVFERLSGSAYHGHGGTAR